MLIWFIKHGHVIFRSDSKNSPRRTERTLWRKFINCWYVCQSQVYSVMRFILYKYLRFTNHYKLSMLLCHKDELPFGDQSIDDKLMGRSVSILRIHRLTECIWNIRAFKHKRPMSHIIFKFNPTKRRDALFFGNTAFIVARITTP